MEISPIPLGQVQIQKTSGVCGGYARGVHSTRIAVWTLVSLRQQGATEQELLDYFPDLSLNDLTAVWGYYYNNKAEIDKTIAEMDD